MLRSLRGRDRRSRVHPTTLALSGLLLVQAGQGIAQPSAASSSTVPVPAAAPDMDAMPDIGLAWPDLGADDLAPLATAPSVQPGPGAPTAPVLPPLAAPDDARSRAAARLAQLDPARPLRYSVTLAGVEEVADDPFRSRFNALSELKAGDGREANLAQITRRARTDVDLVDKLLRTRGYYDGRVFYTLDLPEAGGRLAVTLDTTPGPLYRLERVDISGLVAADPREAALRGLFRTKPGDPADTDTILASTDALRTGLAEGGYPFAKVDEPALTVDHDTRLADLDVVIATGGFRRYGHITVSGHPPFGASHVAEIARFRPGEPWKQSEIIDLNRALVQTGLVSSVDIKPSDGATPGTVDLDVTMAKAPPRTIAGEIGYGTGEGARVEVSWQHRNLFPPEGALTLRGVLGTDEQSASAIFRRSNFKGRDRALNGQLSYRHVQQAAYDARTISVGASLERQTNIIFQKKWTWSIGPELLVSRERDLYGPTLTPRERTYFIGALPGTLAYDGSDDLLDPRRGFRLSGRLSPEASLEGTVFGYARAQMDGSFYVPMGRFTLAARGRLGTIVGATADRIAPTRRYYAGGGGSVRGYSYQAIGPRDANNAPLGGRSLAELSVEGRFRFGSQDQFGVVPFVDAGTISSEPFPSISQTRVGAGLGLRYFTTFGPIRIDVATPINPQPGDPPVGVYVSLGQAF